jgi:hypothetical protein
MQIRIWKVGMFNKDNMMQSIIPTEKAIEKAREVIEAALKNRVNNNGDIDVVWGQDLTVEVHEIYD